MTYKTTKCVICDTEIEHDQIKGRNRKYCSKQCRDVAVSIKGKTYVILKRMLGQDIEVEVKQEEQTVYVN